MRPLSLLPLALCLSCQPTTPVALEPSEPATVGEVGYGVTARSLFTGETCPTERYEALRSERDAVIGAIDHTVTPEAFDALPGLAVDLVEPLVLDQTLPAATELVAELLARLVDDRTDPRREALQALLSLSEAGVEPRHLVALAHAIVDDPEVDGTLAALVDLADDPDGVSSTLETALGLISRLLEDLDTVRTCTDAEVELLTQELLSTAGVGPDDGRAASYAALIDERGVPRVRADAGGLLPAPFVDLDGDGLVDVDADGRPVDGRGGVIELWPFMGTGARDGWGRPLADEDRLVFRYVDVEATALGHLADLGRDAVADRTHRHLSSAVADLLGEPEGCTTSPHCRRYAPDDHPVADLAWLLLGALEDPLVRAGLERGAFAVCTDGGDLDDLVDAALLATGRLFALTEPVVEQEVDLGSLLDFLEALLPNLESLMTINGASGLAPAHRMLDGLDRLDPTIIDAFGYGMEYAEIASPGQCNGLPPLLGQSVRVDFSRPAAGNESTVERIVQLIKDVDRCYPALPVRATATAVTGVPWADGDSMAWFIMAWMGSTESRTVCQLASSVDSLEFLLSPALSLAGGCPDYVDAADLLVLDDMANSGALDIYGVLANELGKDPGGIELIVALFSALADDARLGDDSKMRLLEPILIGAIQTPSSPSDPTGLVQAGLNAGRALNVCDVDTLDAVVDMSVGLFKRRVITRRDGTTVTNTSWFRELLPVMRALVERSDRITEEDWEALTTWARSMLATARSTPRGDRLADPRLASTIGTVLDVLAGPVGHDGDLCYVGGAQTLVDRFLTGENLPALVRLNERAEASPVGEALEDLIVRLLTVEEGSGRGALLALGGRAVQPTWGETDAGPLLDYVQQITNPYAVDQAPLIEALGAVLAADEGAVLRQLLARATDQGETGAERAPIEVLGSAASDVLELEAASECLPGDLTVDLEEAEEVIDAVVDFLRDETEGLGFVYTWIRRRAAALAGE